MLSELRFVVGRTQVVLSVHALLAAAAVVAGAFVVARRAREPAVALPTVAVVAVTALGGAHGLFALLHGDGRGLWTGGLPARGGKGAGGPPPPRVAPGAAGAPGGALRAGRAPPPLPPPP